MLRVAPCQFLVRPGCGLPKAKRHEPTAFPVQKSVLEIHTKF
jgi:hypothetical protein